MKRPSFRDIPPYAAIAIVAMVLLATLVSGREQTPSSNPRHPPRPSITPSNSEPSLLELELDKLVRRPAERDSVDLFAIPVIAAPPPPPPTPARRVEEPPPAPTAPPLPFVYSGRILKGDHYFAYVLRKDELFVAETGENLGDEYRVEGITEDAVHLVYLPLGIKQVLIIPQAQ